jgi:lipoprotein-anchoring transpeptidase ErfK/SrfK
MTMRRHGAVAAAVLLTLPALAACRAAVAGTGTAAGAPPAPRARPAPVTPDRQGRDGSAVGPRARSHARADHRPARRVHAGFFEADGHTYGIGMPIIVRFRTAITDRAAFVHAVTVRLNGAPADGAWDWQPSPAPGWAMEAHYRTAQFWPAHSVITVDAPIKGLPAGRDLAFDDNLTLSMRIDAAHITTVYATARSPHMIVRSDGRVERRIAVSLGAAATPTYRGTKVVEEFDHVENMEGTPVYWSVRLTNSGEFVHAAPWNSQIGRANLSHGCTNLATADAQWFYRFSRLGDVVRYPDAPGPLMRASDGLGDWNVPWPRWRRGGSL